MRKIGSRPAANQRRSGVQRGCYNCGDMQHFQRSCPYRKTGTSGSPQSTAPTQPDSQRSQANYLGTVWKFKFTNWCSRECITTEGTISEGRQGVANNTVDKKKQFSTDGATAKQHATEDGAIKAADISSWHRCSTVG